MRKALVILALAAICGGALYYFRDNMPWSADASDDNGGAPNPIGDIDQPLPPTVVMSPENRWVDLSKAYKGQVVYIDFFATWCSGCTDEVPSLIRFQQKFGDKGFQVVALAIDDEGEEKVDTFVKRQFDVGGTQTSMNFPVMMGTMEIAQKAGFEGGLPSGLLVNRDGKEVKIVRGVVKEAALEKAIARVVKQ
ncbi:MAG TPA: TlpA disulfide reductase family protein [Candidatus Bathyarchaeia archaeon]|nr:TlpA disulfide reductase family protein [Candidatus Bathyarchaeia archaeon]